MDRLFEWFWADEHYVFVMILAWGTIVLSSHYLINKWYEDNPWPR